jgi:anti-sigma factor RsiW
MNHIDELTLNEYLDDALPETERQAVEAHLAKCAVCQAELSDLQQLFFALDNVTDAPLSTNLSVAVEAQIKEAVNSEKFSVNNEQFSVNSWPLLIFELVAAGVLLFLLWPTVQEWLMLARSWQTQLVANVTWAQPISWAEIAASTSSVQAVFDSFQTVPLIDLATMQWAILLGAALIIWLVGNRLLFTSPRQNGGSHG